MMKTAIALGVLVALAGCSKPATTTYYAATSDDAKSVKWHPRDIYVIKDGKPTLTATATCTGIGGKGPCDIKPAPVRNRP